MNTFRPMSSLRRFNGGGWDGELEMDEEGNVVHVKHKSKGQAALDIAERVNLAQRDMLLKTHRLLVAGDAQAVLAMLEDYHRAIYKGDLYDRLLAAES